jgi:hypothetical protein
MKISLTSIHENKQAEAVEPEWEHNPWRCLVYNLLFGNTLISPWRTLIVYPTMQFTSCEISSFNNNYKW